MTYDSIYNVKETGKSSGTESRLVVVRGCKEGGMGNDCKLGMGVLGGDENVLKLGRGDSCTIMRIY
jgi:hypothetical protein